MGPRQNKREERASCKDGLDHEEKAIPRRALALAKMRLSCVFGAVRTQKRVPQREANGRNGNFGLRRAVRRASRRTYRRDFSHAPAPQT